MLPPPRPITARSYEHADTVIAEVEGRAWDRRARLTALVGLFYGAVAVQGSVMLGWVLWELEVRCIQWVLTIGGFR